MIIALLILAAAVAVWLLVGVLADHERPRRRPAATRTTKDHR